MAQVVKNLPAMWKTWDQSLVWEDHLEKGKAKHQRIDAFKLWWWRRLLRVPWTGRRSNQSILKEISPGCSLEGPETPVLWPPDAKSWLIWKDPDAGKDWGQEEKGTTEDEMVEYHHQLNEHEFGYTLGIGDGQGGLACCSSWGSKEQLTWTELNLAHVIHSLHIMYYHSAAQWPLGLCTCFPRPEYLSLYMMDSSWSVTCWTITIFCIYKKYFFVKSTYSL